MEILKYYVTTQSHINSNLNCEQQFIHCISFEEEFPV